MELVKDPETWMLQWFVGGPQTSTPETAKGLAEDPETWIW